MPPPPPTESSSHRTPQDRRHLPCAEEDLPGVFITPDFPQSEIAATNFYDLGRSLGEELGEELGEIFCTLSCFVCCTE